MSEVFCSECGRQLPEMDAALAGAHLLCPCLNVERPKLEVAWSKFADEPEGHVGFARNDIAAGKLFHVIAKAKGGHPFTVIGHYPCSVCRFHKIDEDYLWSYLDTHFDKAKVAKA